MARDGAAIELQRQMATESIVPRTDAEVAPTTLKRIAECKGARSRNVHQPIPGASQQAHRIAAIRLNLGLVEPSQHALLCGFVKHGHGATNVQPCRCCAGRFRQTRPGRSEEHTSELQSLMRTSYAVFCL